MQEDKNAVNWTWWAWARFFTMTQACFSIGWRRQQRRNSGDFWFSANSGCTDSSVFFLALTVLKYDILLICEWTWPQKHNQSLKFFSPYTRWTCLSCEIIGALLIAILFWVRGIRAQLWPNQTSFCWLMAAVPIESWRKVLNFWTWI